MGKFVPFGTLLRKDTDNGMYGHYCPACDEVHVIAVERSLSNGACWTFNGNAELPTFNPSVRITLGWEGKPRKICHYFIRNGKIQYCSDCTHSMAGKTVDLPIWPYPDADVDDGGDS